MNWEAFLQLLARHPIPTIMGVAAIFGIATTFSAWLIHAEACHTKGTVAYESVELMQRSMEDKALRKQAIDEHLAELCRSGQLPNSPVTCAKAELAVGAIE